MSPQTNKIRHNEISERDDSLLHDEITTKDYERASGKKIEKSSVKSLSANSVKQILGQVVLLFVVLSALLIGVLLLLKFLEG